MTGGRNSGTQRAALRKAVWGTVALLGLVLVVATPLSVEVSFTEAMAYGAMLLAAAATYELAVALLARTPAFRYATALALGTAFLLIMMNGAVGIIGSENQPANLLYAGVVAIGLIGAIAARFRPGGLSRAMIVVAIAQGLVPVIARIQWPQVSWGAAGMSGVFALNAGFVILFAGSALLFRHAARDALAHREHAGAGI